MDRPKILVVDDDAVILTLLSAVLKKHFDCVLTTLADSRQAAARLDDGAYDIICTDLTMPGITGFDFIDIIREKSPESLIIIITASKSASDTVQAIRAGAFDYVTKPIEEDQVVLTVGRALDVSRLRQERGLYLRLIEEANRKHERELEMGRRIQSELLPKSPPVNAKFKLSVKFVPSRQLGGDLYDFQNYRFSEHIGVWIADISGHGIPAALLSMLLKAEIRTLFRNPEIIAPDMEQLNDRLLSVFPEGSFVSLFLLTAETATGLVRYAKCSQEPGLLVKRSGVIEELHSEGVLLGCYPRGLLGSDFRFEERRCYPESGDRIVLYTDGVIDSPDHTAPGLGFDGLKQMLQDNLTLDAAALCQVIFKEVTSRTGHGSLEDDFTLIIIDVL